MIDLIGKYFDHPDIATCRISVMLQINQYDVSKALVSIAIEQSLVQVGGSIVLEVVSDKMFEKYQCYIPDCYEYPEYLNTILDGMAVSTHRMIVNLIRNRLEEFSYKEEIQGFLEKLNQGRNIDSSIVIAQ